MSKRIAYRRVAILAFMFPLTVGAFNNCSRVRNSGTYGQELAKGNGHGGYDGKVWIAAASNMSCVDGDSAYARIVLEEDSARFALVRWNCRSRHDYVEPARMVSQDKLVLGEKIFVPEMQAPAEAPRGLTYALEKTVWIINQKVENRASVSGAALVFSVQPDLPPGLALDAQTGTISGTPSAPSPARNYIVRAANSLGSSEALLNLAVADGFQVDTLADTPDFQVGDGRCATAAGTCSLRAAVQEASTTPAVHKLIQLPPGTITLSAGEIALNGDLEIRGSGRTTIDGGGASRLFRASTRPGDSLTLAELTLQNGNATGDGGCVYISGHRTRFENVTFQNCRASGQGGGLAVDDNYETEPVSLDLIRVRFYANTSQAGGGGLALWSLASGSRASITASSFEMNSASDMGGGLMFVVSDGRMDSSLVSGNQLSTGPATSHGGGGLILWDGKYELVNNTITGNTDRTGNAALHTNNNARLSLRHNTVASNQSSSTCAAGGLSMNTGGILSMSGNLFSANTCNGTKRNCGFATPQGSGGYNLSDTADCGLTAPGDRTVTSTLLGPLQDNGGPVQTMALLPASPAIDAGFGAGCPGFDQRGYPRINGRGCDAGAYEAP